MTKRISPDPPPDANKLLYHGHHFIALTAALCSSMTERGFLMFLKSQMLIRLSLPPEAN